jgi:hypothetical protein
MATGMTAGPTDAIGRGLLPQLRALLQVCAIDV